MKSNMLYIYYFYNINYNLLTNIKPVLLLKKLFIKRMNCSLCEPKDTQNVVCSIN